MVETEGVEQTGKGCRRTMTGTAIHPSPDLLSLRLLSHGCAYSTVLVHNRCVCTAFQDGTSAEDLSLGRDCRSDVSTPVTVEPTRHTRCLAFSIDRIMAACTANDDVSGTCADVTTSDGSSRRQTAGHSCRRQQDEVVTSTARDALPQTDAPRGNSRHWEEFPASVPVTVSAAALAQVPDTIDVLSVNVLSSTVDIASRRRLLYLSLNSFSYVDCWLLTRNENVPKIVINDTINSYRNCNQRFGNFKP